MSRRRIGCMRRMRCWCICSEEGTRHRALGSNQKTSKDEERATMGKRIALAYSGGLDTSCIVPWLRENIPGAEVVCVVGDVGQGSDELAGVEKKAKDSGAVECHVVDLKKEFVDEFVFPTMIAG